MSYFQEYEARRSLYRQVQPGSIWKSPDSGYTVVVSSVNLSRGTIDGTWNSTRMDGSDSIKWLLRNYMLVEE